MYLLSDNYDDTIKLRLKMIASRTTTTHKRLSFHRLNFFYLILPLSKSAQR